MELGAGSRVVLETSSHQEAAVRFYSRTGWTEVKQVLKKNTLKSFSHFFSYLELDLKKFLASDYISSGG